MSNFEEYVSNYLNSFEDSTIKDAMIYTMSGGKRIRPRIIFAVAKGFGVNQEKCYPAALALEMIQTYSLIHDDLPAMDNDDFRRGKPSCHKAFREDVAILTGDALLTHSFGVIADSDYDPAVKAKMISVLSRYAGMEGMIKGQLLDVENSIERNEENLKLIHDNKTGGLFKISCLFGAYIGRSDKDDYFRKLGSMIGVIFQYQDDLFDCIRTSEEMGKSLSDKDNDKFTAVSIYGVEGLKKELEGKFRELNQYLDTDIFDSSYLKELINKMSKR